MAYLFFRPVTFPWAGKKMKVLLLTLVGLAVAVFVTGGFQVFAMDIRRRRRGQNKVASRDAPSRGAPVRALPSVTRVRVTRLGFHERSPESRLDHEPLGVGSETPLRSVTTPAQGLRPLV